MIGLLSLLSITLTAASAAVLDARAKGYGPKREIYLRVEGPHSTLFEKTITTQAHTLTTKSGSTSHCDGSVNGPDDQHGVGPTAITALDSAGLSLDGTFYTPDGTQDTIIEAVTSIAGIKAGKSRWAGLIEGYDWEDYSLCSVTLNQHDHVLWAFIPPGWSPDEPNYLKLSGPKTAKVGQTVGFTVGGISEPAGTVVNDLWSDSGKPSVQATVDAKGKAKIKFTKKGTYDLKAHCPPNPDWPCVRSNHLKVVVK